MWTHRPPNHWVVSPNIMEVNQASVHPPPPIMEEIASSIVFLVPLDAG